MLAAMVLATIALAPAWPARAQQDAAASGPGPGVQDAPRRSAMGRVMGVMIEALKQETLRGADADTRAVSTTAAGTPLGIEVGAAFSLDQGRPGEDAPDPPPDAPALPPSVPAQPLAVRAGGSD